MLGGTLKYSLYYLTKIRLEIYNNLKFLEVDKFNILEVLYQKFIKDTKSLSLEFMGDLSKKNHTKYYMKSFLALSGDLLEDIATRNKNIINAYPYLKCFIEQYDHLKEIASKIDDANPLIGVFVSPPKKYQSLYYAKRLAEDAIVSLNKYYVKYLFDLQQFTSRNRLFVVEGSIKDCLKKIVQIQSYTETLKNVNGILLKALENSIALYNYELFTNQVFENNKKTSNKPNLKKKKQGQKKKHKNVNKKNTLQKVPKIKFPNAINERMIDSTRGSGIVRYTTVNYHRASSIVRYFFIAIGSYPLELSSKDLHTLISKAKNYLFGYQKGIKKVEVKKSIGSREYLFYHPSDKRSIYRIFESLPVTPKASNIHYVTIECLIFLYPPTNLKTFNFYKSYIKGDFYKQYSCSFILSIDPKDPPQMTYIPLNSDYLIYDKKTKDMSLVSGSTTKALEMLNYNLRSLVNENTKN